MRNLIKASAAVIAATLFGACNFDQPTPPCAVGHGGYAAELTKLTGPASGTCVRTADIIGVQKYRQDNGNQVIYLKPESIAFWDWYDELPASEYTSLASGELAATTPEDGFCTVPTLDEAFGETFTGENLRYTFSNVEFYVQGSVPGTQFRADLTIEDIDDPTACTATYTVKAMYPVVFCNDFGDDAAVAGEPNDALCGEVDHTWSYVAANPLFNTKCHPYGNPSDTAADHDWLTLFGAWGAETATPWQICVPAGDEIPSLVAGAN